MAVSNYLNFSRAAEHLRITQPAVSHQINTLEDELGVKLFYRTSKRVRLTQAGHLFSQYAQEILSLSSMSKARLKESQHTTVVRFGIGCRSFLELHLLSPVLKQLRQEFPLLLPSLRLVPFDSLENQLEDGDVQVMFTFQESAPKRASYREFTRRPVVCICGEEHPFASQNNSPSSNSGRERASPPTRLTARLPPCSRFKLRSSPAAGRANSTSATAWRLYIPWWKRDSPMLSSRTFLSCPCPASERSRSRRFLPSPTESPTGSGSPTRFSAAF